MKIKDIYSISQPYIFKDTYPRLVNNARLWMSLVLTFSDILAMLLAMYLALWLRLGDLDTLDEYFYIHFLWIPVILFGFICAYLGLYPGIGLSAVEEVRRLCLASSLLFLIIITLTFFLKTAEIYSRIVFIIAWLASFLLLPLTRNLIRRFCIRWKIWGEPVGVVGFPDRVVKEVADFFVIFPQKGINPKVIFVDGTIRKEYNTPYQIVPTQEISASPGNFRIKTILVIVPNWNWMGENLEKYRYTFERVILIRQQKDNFSLSESIALDFSGVMGFQVRHNLLNPWSMALKRIIDITISGLILFLLSPVMVVISLLILFDSPGVIFYSQNRMGKGGKVFKVLKFRTMYTYSERVLEARLKEDDALRKEWNKYQKLKSDPRVTRLGAFLRKHSIDELPQLWNIFKGDMSLVGPRPITIPQEEMYGHAFQDYCQIRPGVTGLWQVSGRNLTTFARRVELDMEYIQRWSLWLDIYIIILTFKEMCTQDGAY